MLLWIAQWDQNVLCFFLIAVFRIKSGDKQIQVVLKLCDFALTCLQIYTTFWIYTMIFGLTWFGIDDPGSCLSSVGG
jgi:hypothetical protein